MSFEKIESDYDIAVAGNDELYTALEEFEAAIETNNALVESEITGYDKDLDSDQLSAVNDFLNGNKNTLATNARTAAVIIPKASLESFGGVIESIGKSVIKSVAKTAVKALESSADSLDNYVNLSKSLRKRLLMMRAMVAVRAQDLDSATKVYSAKTNRRFFQFNSSEITAFSDFLTATESHYSIARYDLGKGVSYSNLIAEKVVKDLEMIVADPAPGMLDRFKDSVSFHWRDVWRDGFKTKYQGSVPKNSLSEIIECKIYPVVALLDARQLVATEPLKAREGRNITKYMAKVVFDKKTALKPSGEITMPSGSDLLIAIDQSLEILSKMFVYRELADSYRSTAKSYKKVTDKLIEASNKSRDRKTVAIVNEYIAVGTGCVNMIINPHTELAWMNIRLGLVVASMAEHFLFDDQKKMAVTAKFFDTVREPVSVAMESRQETYSLVLAMINNLNKS